MGGTSTDVCLIRDGVAGRSAERRVGGLPLRLPQLDIHTVGAGGGSIAWLDSGRRAARRARRAPAPIPGPACYGRGGELPTVTDANLVLGRLDPDVPLAGGLRLDVAAARAALRAVAEPFADVRAAAEGVVAVANAEMVRAIGVVSVEQGHDPRDARAGRVRRGGAAARLRGGRQPGDARGRGARRRRRALGARDRRRGAAPGRRSRSVMRPLAEFVAEAPAAAAGARAAAPSRSSASCATAARRTS